MGYTKYVSAVKCDIEHILYVLLWQVKGGCRTRGVTSIITSALGGYVLAVFVCLFIYLFAIHITCTYEYIRVHKQIVQYGR